MIAPAGGEVRTHGGVVEVEVVLGAADEIGTLVGEVVDVTEAELEGVAVAVFRQEQPLEILEDRAEHAVAQAGRVTESVSVVYVEQKGAASAEEAIIARY
jgi:hypothetical protein